MSDSQPPKNASVPRADRLYTLNEISRVVSATLDLQALYETIYEQIGRVMDATLFFIALVAPNGKTVDVPYMREDGERITDQEVEYTESVTSLVIQRRTSLLFNTDAEYVRYARDNGLPELSIGDVSKEASGSKIFMPLSTGSRTIGALTVQSRHEYAYTPDDVQTLEVIASQAAVAIVNARLYTESRESVDEMEALLRVAQSINSSLNLSTVLDAILTGMGDVIPFYFGAVLLPNYSQKCLEIVGAYSPDEDKETMSELRNILHVPFGQGVTGTVFMTGEPLIVPDTEEFPGFVEYGVGRIRSETAVPLKRGDAVVGVLDVGRQGVGAFSHDDLVLLSLFASQAAIAIENARLFTDQQQRVYELQAIQTIVQKLTPLHQIPTIAAVINQELKRLIDYHTCRVFFLDPKDGMLVPIAFEGPEPLGLRLKPGEGVTGWIAQHGQSLIVPNSLLDARSSQIAGTPVREESMIGAPLVYEGKVRGVIILTKLGINQFDNNALRLLEIVAAQAAIAIDRARLYDGLRTEAVTDDLTRLYNRRYLQERFKEERSRALRNRHSLVALMVDIDKFKVVNDTYGHDAGDVVLQELSAIIRREVRAEDVVSRYGGEEFCILLPEIPVEDAEQVAERLRSSIEQHEMPPEAGTARITTSIGMAMFAKEDQGLELFTRADQAMYTVKHSGGNRVCVFDGISLRFHRPDFGGDLFPRQIIQG